MKRLLILLSFLLFLIPVEAQFLRTGSLYTKNTVPAVVDYCAEYDTVLVGFDTDPDDATKVKQNAMVNSLDSMGIWDRMNKFYVFAAHEQDDESLINWVKPGTSDATNIHVTAWVQWEGYTGDGANDYLESNWVPNTDSTTYSVVTFGRNTATIGVYLRLDINENALVVGANSTNSITLNPRGGGNLTSKINSSSSITVANTAGSGLFISTRRGKTENEVYRDGTHLDNETDASTALPEVELTFLTGSATFSTSQIAIFFSMNAVSDDEATKINTIIERYMDAIGKGVQ